MNFHIYPQIGPFSYNFFQNFTQKINNFKNALVTLFICQWNHRHQREALLARGEVVMHCLTRPGPAHLPS